MAPGQGFAIFREGCTEAQCSSVSQWTAKIRGVGMDLIGEPCAHTTQSSVHKVQQGHFGTCGFHDAAFNAHCF